MLEDLIKEGKKFDVIYSDPPWAWAARSPKGGAKSPSAHYSVMSIEDIKKLPVQEVCNKDAALFMWCIDSMLPEALDTVSSWGFKYKTVGFTWRKLTTTGKDFFGMGYYTRANPEMCLIATRGSPGRVAAKNVRQLFSSEIREHSRKPDEVYDFIEALYPGKTYLEMFARNTYRKDWTKLGNELGKHA